MPGGTPRALGRATFHFHASERPLDWPPRGPSVIDTDVFSADLVPGGDLADRYAPIIAGRPALISFQIFRDVPNLALESLAS